TAAVTRGLGYTDEQVLGTDAVAFVHHEDRERVRALLRALAADPGGSTNAVVRALTANGSTVWFDAEASNLLDVPDVGAIVTKYRDVTKARQERLRTEQMLEQLSRAIEQSADSVFITDAHGVIEYVNPAFEAMTGFTRHEAVGQTPRLLEAERGAAAPYQRLGRTIAAGDVFRDILVNKTKNGQFYDEDQTI